jgi:hypothetical protein
MSQFVRVFRGRLTGTALILVAFALVNPFMLMRANMSPYSHPNIRTRAGTSENWCGYVAVSNLSSPASGFVNSVTGSWVIPTLTGNSSQDTYVAAWVGIDGFSVSDTSIEQIGTEMDYVNGVQSNYAWVEFYPRASRIIPGLTVHNGDSFDASVTYEGGIQFGMSITDVTTGQSYSKTYNAVAQRQSAEWVVEARALANFGTLNFSNAQLTDNTGTTYAIDGRGPGTYDMISLDDPNGGSAEPSGLVDSAYPQGFSSFSVTYATLFVGLVIHDVAVVNVACSKTVVGQGFSASIKVTVANQGNFTETFNVTAYANATSIGTESVTSPASNSTTIILTWNTNSFAYGNYTLSAYAEPVPGETNTTNNNFTGGWIIVSLPGDITGPNGVPDGKVDILDVNYVAKYYGTSLSRPKWNPNADINNDGKVDIRDVNIVAKNLGQHFP